MTNRSKADELEAGWYLHPDMHETLCFWDGNGWTSQVAPAQPIPKPVSTLTIAQGVALGSLFAVILARVLFGF